MIIGGSASQSLAAKVAEELGDIICPIETKKFPDGERYLRFKEDVEGEEVTVIQSTGFPQDEHLIELLFLIKNLKSLNAKKIKVVVPYLGYGRQELRFKPGEAISAQFVAELIEDSGADEFISINLHEDSVREFFNIPTLNLSAMPPIADYINTITEDPIIIAPDKGALGFAEEIAKILNCNCTYMSKVRLGPDKVETRIVDVEDSTETNSKVGINAVKNKEAVIIDDIIATGGTIVNAVNILQEYGAKSVNVCCVHPTLVNDAVIKIYAAGAKNLAGTDTLKSDVSCITVAKVIADAIK
ncbi:MAG: ribose-phosphate diphosphokinase [Methanobacteriaceae archaeon]|uniref:ribose-phosphate diphosphokinase n=1 Tax=unclassified Methanobrevibacter TaxID=2638681 RepID=UPI002A173B64|nr:ribose-phosphate diphosphokinase [Methanobacteriaceae archaeon]MDD3408256.1 ribose-phosphate diphosphokinase [Methanobacteriaceae archaeon]MDD4593836.1 ribose-phosphate diphosphokinase [Methanobacteriaceae archaeon]